MIKSISFLTSVGGPRVHITASGGKFILEKKKRTSTFTSRKTFSAKDFVEFVKHRDPYITLKSGEKLRVYRGGDPTDEVIQTICVVETHDEQFKDPMQVDFGDYYDW